MVQLGKTNSLTILKTHAVGAMLDGGTFGPILLTATSNTPKLETGQSLDVFIYLDAEGELAATTLKPIAEVGQIASFRVADVTQVGAFLDWGLPKDLFVPFAEQQYTLETGRHVLAKVYLDNRNRIAASTRIDHLLSDENTHFKQGEAVSLLIADKTELGYKAIINGECIGLLYDNELLNPIKKGQTHSGFIKKVRDDNKIDLSLQPIGFSKETNDSIANDILEKLDENDGFMMLNDKSPPEAIKAVFGVSKKAFKKACGSLYKKRLIEISARGIQRL